MNPDRLNRFGSRSRAASVVAATLLLSAVWGSPRAQESTAAVNAACSLDIDGNAAIDAATDGALLAKYLFGLRGVPLIDGLVDPGGTRATATAVEAFLAACPAAFDVDGSGAADALTDGLLALRFLSGYTGDALTAGAVASAARCASATAIEAALHDLTLPAQPAPGACAADYFGPYGRVSTYPGIHGNRQNNERIPCPGPAHVDEGWSALADRMIFNPMTISGEGDSLYAVVTRTSGCKLYEVTLADKTETCFPQEDPEALTFGVLASSPEVDRDGNVYVTDGYMSEPDRVVSYDAAGRLRWRTTFEALRATPPERYSAPFGVHFTPRGHVATVTTDGLVAVLNRATGAILEAFDIVAETGLQPLAVDTAEIDASKIPDYIRARLERVIGALSDEDLVYALAGSTGQSGLYTDNTLAISDHGQIFIIGGGPDGDTGALVALDLIETPCSADIQLRWYMPIDGGSGTSPTLDPLNRSVVVGDVSSRLLVADIAACNANTDGDADARPDICAPDWVYQMAGSPLLGSVSMDENGVVYAWQQGQAATADLFAVRENPARPGEPEVLWRTAFGPLGDESDVDWESSEWSSTVLVLDDRVVGTVMHLVAASIEGVAMPFALRTRHEIVSAARDTGDILWRASFPDDSINSPLMGPDGNIYVPILGMFDLTTPNIGPDAPTFQGGIAQYLARP